MEAVATKTRYAIMNAGQARSSPLPGPCSVLSFGDPGHGPVQFSDSANVKRRLHLAFHDCTEDVPWATRPTSFDAQTLLQFIAEDDTGLIVCQCDAGAGRSVATAAALVRLTGRCDRHIRGRGKYDRGWYRLLLEAGNAEPDIEPRVSLAVRVKYPVDRLNLLLLSLRRQRYTNWDAVIVTDGPDRDAAELVESMTDPRLRVIQTPERKGRWGHPYRQIGLEAAAEHGAFVGMANDDDYYAPGYLEQMVQALEWTPAELVLCGMLHAYNGWAATAGFARPDAVSADVGCWLARAELVKRTPWSGAEFTSDSEYVRRLAAGGRSVSINRPLHVKN